MKKILFVTLLLALTSAAPVEEEEVAEDIDFESIFEAIKNIAIGVKAVIKSFGNEDADEDVIGNELSPDDEVESADFFDGLNSLKEKVSEATRRLFGRRDAYEDVDDESFDLEAGAIKLDGALNRLIKKIYPEDVEEDESADVDESNNLSEEDVQMIEKLLDVDEDGVISNEDLAYFQE